MGKRGWPSAAVPFDGRGLFVRPATAFASAEPACHTKVMRRSLLLVLAVLTAASARAAPLQFVAELPPQPAGAAPQSGVQGGRLLVAISRDASAEPRRQISEVFTSQQVFGVDVEGAPSGAVTVDDQAQGFPIARLSDLPAGDYTVQAVFEPYEVFRRADGHVLKLPPDRGEGQQWNAKPGEPMSAPVKLHLAPDGGPVHLKLDRAEPALAPAPADTPYLKHLHLRNERLSAFWGRDVYLDAWVLLPAGWAEHPEARYPLVLHQDHFEARFSGAGGGWRETPPEANLTGDALKRARGAYANYAAWVSGRLPRVILVAVNHANPYYDDSYAVNSANIGPYGDAINLDLIPEIERRYRGIGQGWARAVYGGSTGGWETLATQIFYPDRWNGAWGGCPDPVDFHRYQAANLYDDDNAYVRHGPFGAVEVVSDRASDGEITATMRSVNQFEAALGSHGRSGQQYDAWQAVFSPVGPDGYPAPIYDKQSGKIDKAVAAYWRDHYDLTFILERDWATLGPKVEGKLHIAVGDSDTYFLNNAVHLMDEMLAKTWGPRSDAVFDYGPRAPHCYTGAVPDWAKASGVTLGERLLPQMAAHWLATAPPGADVKSWRY